MSAPQNFAPAYARRVDNMQASEIRELLKLLEQPGIISFAGGIPDPTLFPAKEAAEAYAEALADPAQALQYSVSEGYQPLRAWIAAEMRAQNSPADADNILIVAGSQQGLDFLGKILLDPNDTALTLRPTYLGALQAFSAYGPRYEAIRPEDGNETPAALKTSAGTAGGRVKLAYVVPDFANPTGETLSLQGRRNLLALARDLGIVILEDAAYRALRFAGETLPSLQALDAAEVGSLEASRVAYLGTFSKTVAPGLRLGWVCAAKTIIRRLVLITQASELNVSIINQIVMFKLASRLHAGLVERARKRYRVKRDAMLEALETHMRGRAAWTRPEGGLFVWLTLPEGIDGAELLERAVREADVAFVPGRAFHADGSGANTIRLSYSLPTPAAINEGILRLAGLL
jgi:DNA-binding transcriptional MocR family regulator